MRTDEATQEVGRASAAPFQLVDIINMSIRPGALLAILGLGAGDVAKPRLDRRRVGADLAGTNLRCKLGKPVAIKAGENVGSPTANR